MPSYDYKCKQCGTTVTYNIPVRDAFQVRQCSACGSNLRRVYSVPFVIFNGNGFYSTDKRKATK